MVTTSRLTTVCPLERRQAHPACPGFSFSLETLWPAAVVTHALEPVFLISVFSSLLIPPPSDSDKTAVPLKAFLCGEAILAPHSANLDKGWSPVENWRRQWLRFPQVREQNDSVSLWRGPALSCQPLVRTQSVNLSTSMWGYKGPQWSVALTSHWVKLSGFSGLVIWGK